MNMDFESFVNEMKDHIKEFLPERFADATVEARQNTKLNETYTALIVQAEGQAIMPSINLNQLYEAHNKADASMEMTLMHAAQMIGAEPLNIDINRLLDYDQAKENLFIRVSAAEANKEMLANAPHKLMEDLAITYHIVADISTNTVASTMVTDQMLDSFGISQEQLHADALANSAKLFPAQVQSMGEVMRKMISQDMAATGMSQDDIDMMMDSMGLDVSNPMTVVSNEQGINGAAVMFYPEQMDQIGDRLGGDFFILPSSVHEMLVIPDDGSFQYQDLQSMVADVNETQVAENERLTDEVYHYDTEERVFEKAATFEDRQKLKEQNLAKGKDMEIGIKADKAPEHTQQAAHKPKHKSNDMSL